MSTPTRTPTCGEYESPGAPGPRPRRGPSHRRSRKRRTREQIIRRRRIAVLVLAVVLIFVGWVGVSLGQALTNPALGSSVSARLAEWFREHGGAPIVNWAENVWYSHHQPKKGGKPPTGAFTAQGHTSSTNAAAATTVAHLPTPAPVTSPASPPLPGEGQWQPVGRTIDGVPAVYEAFVRPNAVNTSYVVGIAWMDTKLLSATLYSGSTIPGGGPFTHTAPITPTAATTLVTAFNAGFLMSGANGGYYTDGTQQIPLVNGAASIVIYKDGSINIGAWNEGSLTMTPNVASVRQNLDLLVNNGAPAAGLSSSDNTNWGDTLGGAAAVWRSGLGITANGAIVYVGGPAMEITDVADLLVRAGAVRGMELDINTDWVNFASYAPTPPDGGAATPQNGTNLISSMTGGTDRYFQSYWSRDFVTMSARSTVGDQERIEPGRHDLLEHDVDHDSEEHPVGSRPVGPAGLGPPGELPASQPGSRRQTDWGSRRRTKKAHRRTEGTQITRWLVVRPWTTASATTSAVVEKGAAGRPSVILVLTKPGRTTWTTTPVPRVASERPTAKASRPALAEP